MSARIAVEEGTAHGGMPYLRFGSGRPLVFLTGFAPRHESPHGLARRAALRSMASFAQAGREVWLLSPPPRLAASTTFAALAAVYAKAFEQEFGAAVDAIGHSTGGSLLLQLLADHPDALHRAVVVSSAYTLGPVARRAQRQLIDGFLSDGGFRAQALAPGFARNPVLRSVAGLGLGISGALTRVEHPSDPAALLLAEDRFDVHDRLAAVTTPTLVLGGGRDYFYTPELFAETAALLGNGSLRFYPRARHSMASMPKLVEDSLAFLDAA